MLPLDYAHGSLKSLVVEIFAAPFTFHAELPPHNRNVRMLHAHSEVRTLGQHCGPPALSRSRLAQIDEGLPQAQKLGVLRVEAAQVAGRSLCGADRVEDRLRRGQGGLVVVSLTTLHGVDTS